jgi:ABC-2 type transport system permease protein
MDPQNEPFPVPVTRNVGGFQMQEIQLINYPPFVDIRPEGMDRSNVIVASLPAVTLNWASPVTVDSQKNAGREVVTLLQSSPNSWLRASTDVQPNLEAYPELGFPIEGEQTSYPLAVAIRGQFESFFKGRQMPPAEAEAGETSPAADQADLATIDQSPETARLVVVGSSEFLNDTVFQISSRLSGDRFLNSLQLLQNAVDWSVEDLDLLAIRARGVQTRLLKPLEEAQQSMWEIASYAFAVVAVGAIGLLWAARRRRERPMQLSKVSE